MSINGYDDTELGMVKANKCCPYCGWTEGAITEHKSSGEHAHLAEITYFKCGVCKGKWRAWDREK